MTRCTACHQDTATDGLQCKVCRAGAAGPTSATDATGGTRVAPALPSRSEADPALFIAWCRQRGVAEPVAEFRFDSKRKWRFDYCWPDHRVALEVEGGAFSQGRHTRGKGFKADCEKYNEATARGWRLLRVLPSQLCTLDTLLLIRRTLAIAA